jgi:nucleoside-diphosphate-sugar epimerase
VTRVLVVGATGFVGGAVARHLAGLGHAVAGQVRGDAGPGAGIVAVPGDLDGRLPAVLERARRSDAVVYAAQAPPDTERAAVAALLDTGTRVLFTSGTGVLGRRTWGDPGAGRNRYSTLPIGDAVDLYAAALHRGRPGALYHGVSGEVTGRALADAVAADLGVPTRSLTRAEAAPVAGRGAQPKETAVARSGSISATTRSSPRG